MWTRGGGTFKVSLLSDLLQGRRGTLWVTAVLIWWFPGFYSSAARESSSLPLHSGGWSFYRAAPSCDMIILKSQHGLCFVVGDWPPFVTEAPISPPWSAPLHRTYCLLPCWKSGVLFPPPVRKARRVLWLWCHRGALIHNVCDITAVKCKFT